MNQNLNLNLNRNRNLLFDYSPLINTFFSPRNLSGQQSVAAARRDLDVFNRFPSDSPLKFQISNLKSSFPFIFLPHLFQSKILQHIRRDYSQGIRHRSAYFGVAIGFFKTSDQSRDDRKIVGREIQCGISSLAGKYRSNFLQSRTAHQGWPGAIRRDVEKYWQPCGTKIKHGNQSPHRRALGQSNHQTLQFGRNLRRCRSKNSKSFHGPYRLVFPVINQPVELARKNAPDLRLSRLLLPLRPVVTHPFDQPGQSVRSDVPDSIFSLRPAIVVSPGSGDFQPLTQLLAVIFRFVVTGPKLNHTNPDQNTHWQNDDDPFPAHKDSVLRILESRNLFAPIFLPITNLQLVRTIRQQFRRDPGRCLHCRPLYAWICVLKSTSQLRK